MRAKSWKSVTAITSWGLALFGAATLCSACGDDGGGALDGGTDTDSDTDADGSLEVLVLSHSWDADPAPAAGALVTLDKPGGERVELTAGADGTVAFDAINWSLGEAAATASMDGHGMASRVGITEADGAITLRIPLQPLETVTLSGTVTNMTDEANWLEFYVIAPGGGFHQATGPDYAIEVPAGVPFGLSGIEFTWEPPSTQGSGWVAQNWFWQEMEPITELATSDITFEGDGGVETTEVSGSFDYSLTAGTPLSGSDGVGLIWATVMWENYRKWSDWGWWGGSVGWGSSVDVNADGTAFDYTIEFMEPASIDQYVTYYAIDPVAGPWSRTEVIEAGLPTAGSHAIDFVDVPVLSSIVFEVTEGSLTWESAETDVRPSLIITVGEYTWVIDGPVGAAALAVPEPPAGALLAEQIESGVHNGNLTLTRDAADSTPELWLGARSYSRPFSVTYTP